MDYTVRNVSDLEKALQQLNTDTQPDTNRPPNITNPSIHQPVLYQQDTYSQSDNEPSYNRSIEDSINLNIPKRENKNRLETKQYSTNSLLYNLCGLQTSSNNKLDGLTDAVLRLQQTMQQLCTEQSRQTELLAAIARNTALSANSRSESTKHENNNRGSSNSITEYGFTNVIALLSEFIIKIIKQVEIQINSRGHGYRSTRTMDHKLMKNAVDIACKNQFKNAIGTKDALKLPSNKDESAIRLAQRIGSIDDIAPILDPNSLRELFTSIELRSLMAIVQDVIERLSIIRIMLPFYEADMINAISFPYFDGDGQIICDWNKIRRRDETKEEAAVMNAAITSRKQIGELLAKGVSIKAAISAIIRDTKK